MGKRERGKPKNHIKKACILLFWLCVWQFAAWAVGNSLLAAGPWETLLALAREAASLTFWQTIGMTLLKLSAGFLAALALGSLLGAISYRHPLAGEVLSPVMLLAKAVPVASFAVILLIWWGSGKLSAAISFLMALPIIYVNVREGLANTDAGLLEMAAVFRLPAKSRFFYLYLPALKPFLEGALKTAVGMSIKAGVAAEIIGLPGLSIGGELYLSKIYLDTAGVFAWTFVVILLSFCLERAVLFCFGRFCAWMPYPAAPAGKAAACPLSLKLENIFKSYGEEEQRTVLNGVNMELDKDRNYCLMAPSGAGKTTLLRILAGLIKADKGRIICQEKDGGNVPLQEGSLSVSMVFQEDRLVEEAASLRNVELVCGDTRKAEEILRQLLPGEDLERPVKLLSGGMRRRVCIARALAAESGLLLLDEPFGGLDADNRKRAVEVVLRYRKGRLLIAATHEKEDVVDLGGELLSL